MQRTELLTVIWIKDNYIRHKHFSELKSETCRLDCLSHNCKKVTVNSTDNVREYYLIRHKGYKLQSWEEAADRCQEMGGYLPWVDSRDSLYELLSLFKLSRHFPTTEAIFIGLKYNTTEVSIVFLFVSCTFWCCSRSKLFTFHFPNGVNDLSI